MILRNLRFPVSAAKNRYSFRWFRIFQLVSLQRSRRQVCLRQRYVRLLIGMPVDQTGKTVAASTVGASRRFKEEDESDGIEEGRGCI